MVFRSDIPRDRGQGISNGQAGFICRRFSSDVFPGTAWASWAQLYANDSRYWIDLSSVHHAGKVTYFTWTVRASGLSPGQSSAKSPGDMSFTDGIDCSTADAYEFNYIDYNDWNDPAGWERDPSRDRGFVQAAMRAVCRG